MPIWQSIRQLAAYLSAAIFNRSSSGSTTPTGAVRTTQQNRKISGSTTPTGALDTPLVTRKLSGSTAPTGAVSGIRVVPMSAHAVARATVPKAAMGLVFGMSAHAVAKAVVPKSAMTMQLSLGAHAVGKAVVPKAALTMRYAMVGHAVGKAVVPHALMITGRAVPMVGHAIGRAAVPHALMIIGRAVPMTGHAVGGATVRAVMTLLVRLDQVPDLVDVYRLYLRDQNLVRVGEIDDYSGFEAVLRFNDVSTWTLKAPVGVPALESIDLSGQGLVLTRNGVDVLAGPVETILRHEDPDGGYDFYELTGTDDTGLLGDPFCSPDPAHEDGSLAPPYTRAYDDFTGTAEATMRHYVDVNLGPNAHPARRAGLGALVTLGGYSGLGPTTVERGRFEGLLSKIRSIAAQGNGLRFQIVQDPPNRHLVFTVTQPADKTSQVIFSRELGTARETQLEQSVPTANYVVVGDGQGEGVQRGFVAVTNQSSISRYQRRIEAFRDQRDNSANAGAQEQAANEELQKGAAVTSTTFTPLDTPTTRFGRNYNLGDQVTTVITGQRVSGVVTEVKLTLDSGGVFIQPTVSDLGAQNLPRATRALRELDERVARIERYSEPPTSGAGLLWTRQVGEIPVLWQRMDGSLGTTDLRDLFIVGVGLTHVLGSTYGNATVNIAHAHSHQHGINPHGHSFGSHQHSVNSHSHGFSIGAHSHSVNSHSHGFSFGTHSHSGADHSHGFVVGLHHHSMNHGHSFDLANHQHPMGDHHHNISQEFSVSSGNVAPAGQLATDASTGGSSERSRQHHHDTNLALHFDTADAGSAVQTGGGGGGAGFNTGGTAASTSDDSGGGGTTATAGSAGQTGQGGAQSGTTTSDGTSTGSAGSAGGSTTSDGTSTTSDGAGSTSSNGLTTNSDATSAGFLLDMTPPAKGLHWIQRVAA
jgi:hypothetical protein